MTQVEEIVSQFLQFANICKKRRYMAKSRAITGYAQCKFAFSLVQTPFDSKYNVCMDFSLFIPLLSGLLAGWLTNYLADLLPRSRPLNQPVCQNPDCGAAFRWADYLLLRRCPKCGHGRGLRTFAVLVLAVALSFFIWFSPPHRLGFALGLMVLTYLLLVTIIDLEHRLILRPLSILGFVLAALVGFYARGWQSTLIGGAAGFVIMFVFYLLGKLFTRWRARRLGKADDEESLGSGDVTLAAILGLLLGWPLIWFGLLLGILFSGAIGLIIIFALLLTHRYRTQAFNIFIPYGPFFSLSTFILIYLPMWMSSLLQK